VSRPERKGSLGALRHRDFAIFWTAAAISNAGGWMQVVAIPAFLYDLTGKASWLGYASLASLMPAVFLTPYAGVLADRIPRRTILLVTQTMQMTVAALMWYLFASDQLTPGLIIGLGFVTGVATGFQTAAWQSFVPLLVPPDEMLDAVKLNSVQFTLARALGPAFAGVTVAAWGTGAAIGINTVTYALVILALVFAHPRATPLASRTESVMLQMRGGARYVWRNRPLRLAVSIAFITALSGQSLQHVAPAIAEDVLGRDSTDNAGLLVALGLGALASSGFSVIAGDRLPRSTRVLVALGGFLLSCVMIAATSNYVVGLAGYFIGGMAHLQSAVALNTMIQGCVPEHVRGRTMSFYVLGILLGIPVGSYMLGGLGDLLGMRTALIVNAAIFGVVIVVLMVARLLPDLDTDHIPDDDHSPVLTLTEEPLS
jgi:predicted MFS family arabinose efflux permease